MQKWLTLGWAYVWLWAPLVLCKAIACGEDESSGGYSGEIGEVFENDPDQAGYDLNSNEFADTMSTDGNTKPSGTDGLDDDDLFNSTDVAPFADTVTDVASGDTAHDSADDTAFTMDGDGPDAPSDVGLTDQTGDHDSEVFDGGLWDAAPVDIVSTEDSSQPWTGPTWDMAKIADPQTANCLFSNHKTIFKDGVLLDVWNVTYTSWESIDGNLNPITIKGFAARPTTLNSNAPAIVVAHGLGGHAEENNATSHAARLSLFTLAYSGPGGGTTAENTSEGLGAAANSGKRMFDTIPDPRGSWFWAHATAAMRGLTCLAAHPDVDPNRLGITGFSAGGVVSLIAASVDVRVKAAVPLSGTGQWDVATVAPAAWQHSLLKQAGLDTASEEWNILVSQIEPGALTQNATANVLMVNGSTDEFFPLTAHVATYDPIPNGNKRTSIAANFDHGCYALTGVENTAIIEERAKIRAEGGQKMMFSHTFGTNSDYSYVPMPPSVQVTPIGAAMAVVAVVDSGGSKLQVKEVTFWGSNDNAFFWGGAKLESAGNGIYQAVVPAPMQANTTYYVDVEYQTKAVLFPDRFSISSVPVIPPGFVPHIRDINSCL